MPTTTHYSSLITHHSCVAVHLLRVENAFTDDCKFAIVELAEEATLVALVAGRTANLTNFEKYRIGIAVDEDADHLLHVPALLTFSPQLVPTAAEVDSAPSTD